MVHVYFHAGETFESLLSATPISPLGGAAALGSSFFFFFFAQHKADDKSIIKRVVYEITSQQIYSSGL